MTKSDAYCHVTRAIDSGRRRAGSAESQSPDRNARTGLPQAPCNMSHSGSPSPRAGTPRSSTPGKSLRVFPGTVHLNQEPYPQHASAVNPTPRAQTPAISEVVSRGHVLAMRYATATSRATIFLPTHQPGDASPTSTTLSNQSRSVFSRPSIPLSLSSALAPTFDLPRGKVTIRADPAIVTCFDPADKELYDLWAPKR